MSAGHHICETEKIAAFIDGDLDQDARGKFEEHLTYCSRCNSELQAQRQFMCELDSALAEPFELAVPPNFAQVVAVRAESDMRGARNATEHARAAWYCLWLGLAAFALLGVTSSQAALSSAELIANKVIGVVSMVGKAVYDAAAGFLVIVKVLSGGLGDSRLGGLAALLLVVLAAGLLSLLISRYHRARLTE